MRRALPLVLAALPGLAAAQEGPACGGLGAEGMWLGATPEASDAATAAARIDAEVTVPVAGRAVALLRLSEPTGLRVEAVSADGDPYLALLDATGAEVAADDDSGPDFNARAEADLPAGDYCLVARSYAPTDLAVTLAAGRVDLPPLAAPTEAAPAPTPAADAVADAADATGPAIDAGCAAGGTRAPLAPAPVAPADLAAGLSATGTVAETPSWSFTLVAPSAVTVTATSEAGDPVLALHRDDGTRIAENDDFDGLNSRIDTTEALAPGTYCLALRDLNGDANPITVGLSAFDPAADRLRRIGEAELPPAPSDPVEVRDLGPLSTSHLTEIAATATAAWVAFDVPEGGLLVAEAVAGREGLDPTVRLFDRLGRVVAENDDAPDGSLDSLLTTRILPGRYLMSVRLLGDNATGPVRLLLERYVPAR